MSLLKLSWNDLESISCYNYKITEESVAYSSNIRNNN